MCCLSGQTIWLTDEQTVTRNALPDGNEITWLPAVNVVLGSCTPRISTGWRLTKSPSVPLPGWERGVVHLDDGTGATASATGVDGEGEGAAGSPARAPRGRTGQLEVAPSVEPASRPLVVQSEWRKSAGDCEEPDRQGVGGHRGKGDEPTSFGTLRSDFLPDW